uniref:Uncharacterized protein n=1 Tax=Oryza barthii TaxID=65489 RepID=A0A0D3HRB4_9ORYZ
MKITILLEMKLTILLTNKSALSLKVWMSLHITIRSNPVLLNLSTSPSHHLTLLKIGHNRLCYLDLYLIKVNVSSDVTGNDTVQVRMVTAGNQEELSGYQFGEQQMAYTEQWD